MEYRRSWTVMTIDEIRRRLIEVAKSVQALPYVWPAPPTAGYARERREGSCASKHALLAEELETAGIDSAPLLVVGPLVPPMLAGEAEFTAAAALAEVHECLTVVTPWAGPLRVDVTWDPPLIERGLPGTLDWDGAADMPYAIGEAWETYAVNRGRLREMKEALRSRLYGPGERDVRDAALAAMVRRFAEWRSAE
jgi:hypothetical protein